MNNRQITVSLVTRTALHVGSGQGDAVTDAFVRQDAQGNPVVPGTSLAGALRAMATRLAPRLNLTETNARCKALGKYDKKPCGCVVCRLFGDVIPADQSGSSQSEELPKATAARLWIHDACLGGDVSTWIRDGVGIERATGAAYRQGQIKFDTEVLPPGVEFELKLELEAGGDSQQIATEERLLAATLSAWAEGRASVGGRTSRGLGALELQKEASVLYRSFDLSEKEDLLAYLSNDEPWSEATEDAGWLARRIKEIEPAPLTGTKAEAITRCWVRLNVRIQATGPFLINNPVSSAMSGFDHAPLLTGIDREKPILPGSSLKGALRSQAEKIARTLATKNAGSGDEFLRICPVCSPVARRLNADAPEPQESCDSLLQAHRVVETTKRVQRGQLCLACQLFGSPRLGSRLRVEDAKLAGKPQYKPLDFLAIDRFTGGGADRFKFDAAVLWRPEFKARLYLEDPEPWELGWLLLSLRDFDEGLATVGFGAAKGFGQIQAKKWRVEFGYLTEGDGEALGLPSGTRKDGNLYYTAGLSAGATEGWMASAQSWVNAFAKKAGEFQREKPGESKPLPALPKDTFFGTGAERLYDTREESDD